MRSELRVRVSTGDAWRRPYRSTAASLVTVLVQYAIGTDGRVDMTTVRPIRAYAQPFVDAVVAVLPALRYTPALAGGCPTRTVLMEHFVVRPPRS